MVKIQKATVRMTESTLKQLLAAVQQAVAEDGTNYMKDAVPNVDMSEEDRIAQMRWRGVITVKAPHSPIIYEIELLGAPQAAESSLYKLCGRHKGA